MDTKRTVWFLVGLLALLLLGWAGVQEAAAAPDAPAANKTITTITEDNPDPSVYGQGYYVRFSLDTDPYNGITPYGTVTVDDGESHTCSRHCWSTDSYCPDDWYIWWWGCTLTGSTPGVKTITATFVPSDTTKYKGSTTTTTHVVNKADTKTTLASSPNPSAEGQSVTFSATVVAVAPGSGTPTGSVEFYADGVLLGTGTLNSSGVATLSATTLTAGVHWITAVYLGDANFRGSESAALAQRVADADLKIIKLVKPDGEVEAGGTVVYTVLVDNLGPGAASNLVLSDTMTASGAYTVQSIAPVDGGSCTSAASAIPAGADNRVTIRCTLASLPAHQRWTIIVTAVADEAIDINNVAGVYATSPSDPNLDNNYASGAIAVTETDTADLAVVKEAVEASVAAGETACWDVTVTNNGPSTAENVVLVDLLPPGLVDGSITTGNEPGCSFGTPGDPADPLVCNVGTLVDGGSWSVTVCGNVDPAFVLNQPDTSQANYLDNDAWAYADTFDPDNSDNRDTDHVGVTESADLSLAKYAVGTPVAGTEIHYEYQIANAGPSWSEDVTLRDSLPGEVEFLGALVDFENGTGGVPLACDVTAGANVLFCPLGDIPPTGSTPILVFVNVRIKPDATGSLVNTADLLTDTPDPDTTYNSATKTVTVQNGASLSIVKTAADPSPVAGGEQVYTIVVTNDGPSTAPEVEIVDRLPPPSQVTPLYASDSACTFSTLPTNVFMECDIGDLGPGETYQVDLHVRLAADLECGSTFVNRARVSWFWNMTGVETEVATPIDCEADLAIQKFGKPDGEVLAGEELIYRLVVDNLGPSAAPNVVVTDTIISSGEFTVGNWFSTWSFGGGSGGTCDELQTVVANGQQTTVVACTLEEMPPSARTIIEFGVTADETQDINDLATVKSDAFDPDGSNNQAIIQHEITDVADLAVSKQAVGEVQVYNQGGLVFEGASPGQAFPTASNYTTSTMDVTAGRRISYTLTVANAGPSTAENVVLNDRLPAGVQIYPGSLVAPAGAGCATGTPGEPLDRLTCGLGTIPAGGAAAVSFQVIVDPAVPEGTALENDAWVSSDLYDPDNGDNAAYTQTMVRTWADLWLVHYGSGPVLAGDPYTYVLRTGNLGPSLARNAILAHQLPDGVEFLNAALGQGSAQSALSCAELEWNMLLCPLGDIPPSANGYIDILVNVRVKPDATGTLHSSAWVDSSTKDPYWDNNDRQYAITPGHEADLAIAKTSEPMKVFAGEQKKYTITVTNHGPSDALEVLVTDTLPAELSYEIDNALCDVSGQVVTCSLSTLPAGASRSLEIWALVAPDTLPGTVLVNEATVASTTFDPALGDNTALAENLVLGKADLRVVKFGKPDGEVRAGENLTYTVIVDNLGPGYAHDVELVDLLQSSGTFELVSVESYPPANCTPAPGAFSERLEMTCALEGPLEVQGRWLLKVIVTAAETQDINNQATVWTSDLDPDPGNNHAEVMHEITDVADLAVEKRGPETVTAGGDSRYSITVTNNGPSTAENVVVIDRLPAGIAITGIDYDGFDGQCATGTPGSAADRLTCALGSLPAGGTATIGLDFEVAPDLPAGMMLENDVLVASDIYDPDNSNNLDYVLTRVATEADLGFVKFDTPDPVVAGRLLTFPILIINNGPSVARDVRLYDRLPPGTRYHSDTLPGAQGCEITPLEWTPYGLPLIPAGAVRCDLGDLQPGQFQQFSLALEVDPSVPDGTELDNLAILLSLGTDDPDLQNNVSTTDTTVAAEADLVIAKAGTPTKVYAGEQVKYTITVANLGPSDAQEVVVVDTLPAEVAYEIDTALCDVAGGVVTCELGMLPAGATRSLEIWALVDPATLPGTVLLDEAIVSSATTDPVQENNAVEAENLVLGKADLKVVKFGKMDGEVLAGEMLTYTVVVDNLGPGYAHDVELVDLLQSSGTFDLVSVTSDRPALCAPESGTFTERLELSCTLTDALEVQGRWLLTVIVTAAETQDINNLAVIQTSDLDPDAGNNQAYVEHAITDVSDLNVSKCAWWAAKNKWECGDDAAPVVAGKTARYRLYLTNNGPSTAQNPVIVDTLPLGTSLVSLDDPGWDCSITQPAAGQTAFTCGYPNLAAGEMAYMTYTVLVDPSVPEGTILVNGASGASDLFDPNAQNNYDEMLLKVQVENDLWIEKTDEPDPVIAGNTLLYYVEAGNNGPSTAWDVLLWDGLPAQVVFQSATVVNRGDTICSYAAVAHEINCATPALKPGETVWLKVEVQVKGGTAGNSQIHNEAEVWSTADHAATAEATKVLTRADLSIEKAGEPAKVLADGQVKYTLTVKNGGPSAAQAVVVTDELPEAVQAELLPSECAEVSAGEVECALGSMAAGEVRVIELWVRVKASARDGTELYNEACVSGATTLGDPVAGNNCDDATGLVLGLADLKVAKYGPAGAVTAGQDLTYLIIVDNLGPGYAHQVAVEDVLQSTGRFQLISVTSDRPASCSPPSGSFNRLLKMRCELDGALEVRTGGASGRWILTAVLRAVESQSINNIAGVTGSDPDPNLANNEAVVQSGVSAVADLAIEKLASGQMVIDGCGLTTAIDHVTAGLELTYLLTVSNHGPSAAAEVTLEDRLPAGIVVTSVTASQGSCQTGTPGASGDKLTCGLGALAAGKEAEVTVVALVPASTPAGTVLENDVAVSSAALDTNNANDAAVNMMTVTAAANLTLDKQQSPAFVMPGDEVTYRLMVENLGPSDAVGAVVSDTMPAELIDVTWECIAYEGASCPASGTGDLAHPVDLPAGGRLVFTIHGIRDRFGTGPTLTNSAELLSPAGVLDCDTANNADTVVNRLHKVYLPLVPKGRDLPPAPDLVVREVRVTAGAVEVVIANRGTRSVENPFWVDLYLDPDPAPAAVNETWPSVALQGMAWGVADDALPLEPGETLTLRYGDPFYAEAVSYVEWPIAPGTVVYVQVDSSGDPAYGGVLENHEMAGWRYNNISEPVVVVAAVGEPPAPLTPLPEGRGMEGLPTR